MRSKILKYTLRTENTVSIHFLISSISNIQSEDQNEEKTFAKFAVLAFRFFGPFLASLSSFGDIFWFPDTSRY